MKPAQIRAMYAKADEALNVYIENEMRAIMQAHPKLTCLLKCMGDLTSYDKHGSCSHNWGTPPLKRVQRLADMLDEMDGRFYVRTAKALRITRNPDGSLSEVRDW